MTLRHERLPTFGLAEPFCGFICDVATNGGGVLLRAGHLMNAYQL